MYTSCVCVAVCLCDAQTMYGVAGGGKKVGVCVGGGERGWGGGVFVLWEGMGEGAWV